MEEARKIQVLLKKKNEEMRRHLMQQSSADQDRLRRQNINARLLQPGSVTLRSSLIQSMCAESCGHPRVDAKVRAAHALPNTANHFETSSVLCVRLFDARVATQVNAVIKELRCDKPLATAASSATCAARPPSVAYFSTVPAGTWTSGTM